MTRKILPIILASLLLAAIVGCASNKQAATTKQYAFWPPAPDEPRLQYLCSFASSDNVGGEKSKLEELVYGKESRHVQGISKPYGIAMHGGKIYVCDLRSNAVVILDLRNQRTLVIGQSGSEIMQQPSDIAIAPDGIKYVADSGRSMIFTYDANDRYVGSIALPNAKPVGLAVFQNELFVCDFKGQNVKVLNRGNGQVLRTIGGPGQAAGQFVRPLGIDVDVQGNVYVTDVLNCRMQKFDRQGNLLTAFGITSANAGGFVRPKHIAVDKRGTIYVVDAAFQNVQLFDQIGRVYTFFGSAGSHPGSMYLPAGVAVHDGDLDLFQKYVHPDFAIERLVLVTNQFGDNKVAVYGFGKLKEGKTVADIAASQMTVASGVGSKQTSGGGAALPGALPADRADEFRGTATPATMPAARAPAAQPARSSSPSAPPAAATNATARK
jgi:DNA-binding beta-propeller fold protein YncE